MAAVVREVVEDPYFPLTDGADDKRLAAAHYAKEAERIAEEIERRRGAPVHVRSYQSPDGVYGQFRNFPTPWRCGFSVTPDDMITLMPWPR